MAQAAEVGVSAGEIQGVPSRGRGFPRGRGRGRGYFPSRGRGGTLIKNISLDNRTRRLAVKGLNADDDHALTKLEEWYKVRTAPESIDLYKSHIARRAVRWRRT